MRGQVNNESNLLNKLSNNISKKETKKSKIKLPVILVIIILMIGLMQSEISNLEKVNQELQSTIDNLVTQQEETKAAIISLQPEEEKKLTAAEEREEICWEIIHDQYENTHTAFYYVSLHNSLKQEAYDQILESIARKENRSVDLSYEDFVEVVRAIEYDHPELFFVDFHKIIQKANKFDNEDIVEVVPYYFYNSSNTDDIKKQWEEIKAFREQTFKNISDFSTQRDKFTIIFSEIAVNTRYTTNAEYGQSLYGVITGETVCSGYAKMYQFLAHSCGEQTICARAKMIKTDPEEEDIYHLVNIVKLNSENYIVDSTSAMRFNDDGTRTINYVRLLITKNIFNMMYEFTNDNVNSLVFAEA